jgi:hypothetical protein
MATVTPSYAAEATLTIGLATTPLASSSTFVGGRESTEVDNSANKYDDALLSGQITVGTTPTINTQILVYAFSRASTDTPTYPDVMDGTDSDETLTSFGVGQGFLKLLAVLNVDSTTSNRAYAFGPVSVAQAFGGVLPKFWSVFVAHNTGVALNSTAGNHFLKYVGVKYDVA